MRKRTYKLIGLSAVTAVVWMMAGCGSWRDSYRETWDVHADGVVSGADPEAPAPIMVWPGK